MTMRLPPDLTLLPRREAGHSALARELMGEGAAALGRLGSAVERALAEWRALAPDADAARRDAVRHACSHAVWMYFVQREMCGLQDHAPVIEAYAIPREVLAVVGTTPRG